MGTTTASSTCPTPGSPPWPSSTAGEPSIRPTPSPTTCCSPYRWSATSCDGSEPSGPAREEAERALAGGGLVLDYPGGDWEACRPWVDRNTVDFGGRTGFVRLALRSGVPVIPVVAHGSHDSVIVVARGDRIARVVGLGALRIKVFPILWGPLGLTSVLVPPPPLPSSVTVEVLPPMDWGHLGPSAADDPRVVERCSDEVIETMQTHWTASGPNEPTRCAGGWPIS